MATTPINNIIRGGAEGKSLFASALPVLSSAVNYNQGDLLCFDTTNKVLIAAATGNSANFLGVAINTVVSGLPKSPYQGTAVDASEGFSDMGGPLYSVVATLILDTGSALAPGQYVYLSQTSAQNVTPTSGGGMVAIGIYTGSQGTQTSSVSGLKVDILVGANYPTGTLKF